MKKKQVHNLTCADLYGLFSDWWSFIFLLLGSGNSVTDLEAGACGERRASSVAGVC
jgi:hypothetical protein